MTLEEVYYIGQTIAAVAILASLLGIFFQLKQSTKIERASAQRELLDRVSLFAGSFSSDDYTLWAKGLTDFENANFETKGFIHNKLIEFVFITESAFNMHRDGFFSEGTWAGIEGAMLGMLKTPGGRSFWDYAQHMVGFEIAEHLNKRLAEVGEDGPTILDAIPFARDPLSASPASGTTG